jgi:CheY-like chemotaxis protein
MEKRRVMIVDDEEDFTKIIKLNLEDTGRYEVLALPNAKDILSWVHSFKPAVILLDILMPAIGGIEVCEILNNDSIGKNIPIIVLSALDKDTDKLKAYKVGVVDYLVKPIEINELITKIEKALRLT